MAGRRPVVSDDEFFYAVKALLTVPERSICEEVMDGLSLSPAAIS